MRLCSRDFRRDQIGKMCLPQVTRHSGQYFLLTPVVEGSNSEKVDTLHMLLFAGRTSIIVLIPVEFDVFRVAR